MMMQDTVKNRELVSALADGQLRGEEFAGAVEWVGSAEEARLTWHAYHVVGDVLRSGEAVASHRDAAFVERLKLGLQRENLAPASHTPDLIAVAAVSTRALGVNSAEKKAANDTLYRWKLLAGVASLAFVSLVGWQGFSNGGGASVGTPQLAQLAGQSIQPEAAAQPVVAVGEPQVMIRDPQLDALVAAHKQFGGTSALQMPAGFLRNATFEGAAR